MTLLSRISFRAGQAHGILGYGAIPGADIPTALVQKYMPKNWSWSMGMRSPFVKTASPWAMGASALYYFETSGTRARMVDTLLGNPPEGEHWEHTPKTGVKRTIRNPSMSPMPDPYIDGGVVYLP